MLNLTVVTHEGETREITSEAGLSVMEAIRGAGIDKVQALCGGSCSCATCHVHIDPGYLGKLPPMSEEENELLESTTHRNGSSRLSCQIEMADLLDGLRLKVAEED